MGARTNVASNERFSKKQRVSRNSKSVVANSQNSSVTSESSQQACDQTATPESPAQFDFAAWASTLIDKLGPGLRDEDRALLNSQIRGIANKNQLASALPPDPTAVTIVRSQQHLRQVIELLAKAPEVAIDLETSSLDPLAGEIVGVGLSAACGNYYVPINHRFEASGLLRPDQLPLETVATALRLGELPLVAHNAKFEYRWLRRHAGIECRFVWDVMLAARLIASHLGAELKELGSRELDVPDWSLSQQEMKRMQFLPIEQAARYCAKDCYYTLELMRRQQLCASLSLFLMKEVELPLVPVVARMEDSGYRISLDHFEQLRQQILPVQEQKLKEIREVVGEHFNPNSAKQLRELLYDRLNIKVIQITKKGQPATGKKVLGRVSKEHPVAGKILEYKKLKKILSTYCKDFDDIGEDGRLHTAFNQLDTTTGRFSSPSIIQTIPKSIEFKIRHGFVASDSCSIVAVDFKQQEMRLLAQVSEDESLRSAIDDGIDLHGLAARKVFSLQCEANEVEAKHPEERGKVKAIQFGLIYGRTAYTIAETLGISTEDAEQLIESYFKQYPKVQKHIDGVHTKLMKHGFVEDVFGRRRYFPDIQKEQPRRNQRRMSTQQWTLRKKTDEAKREAQNFVIQGAAATITKLAMLRCDEYIRTKHPGIKMVLQLHDELQFEVPNPLVGQFTQDLPDLMCNLGLDRFGFVVPMEVEIKVGPSWGEAKKVEGLKHE